MKELVGTFNNEKDLEDTFPIIVKTNCEIDGSFAALIKSVPRLPNGTVFGYTLDRTAAAAGSLPSLVR